MQFLSAIMSFCNWLRDWFVWLMGMAGKTTQLPKWVYHLIHYSGVFLVTVLLAWKNDDVLSALGIQALKQVSFLEQFPVIHQLIELRWAACLFLLSYIFVRLLIYFIRQFWQEEQTEFPDIDEAWATALRTLSYAGTDIRYVDLFLVLGVDEKQEPHVVRPLGLPRNVVAPSTEVDCPLRVYADRETVYVVCSNVSAISAQCRIPQDYSLQDYQAPPTDQSAATLNPADIKRMAQFDPSGTMGPADLQRQRNATDTSNAAGGPTSHGRALQGHDLYVCERRVRHLCRLITQSRAPTHPVSGVMTAVPIDWARPGSDQGYYECIRQDIGVLHESLKMVFPVICLFTGLYQTSSFSEFLTRAGSAIRGFDPQARVGSSFPPALPVDEKHAVWLVDKWLHFFRHTIYSSFAHELSSGTNPQLYRLLCELEDLRPGLIQLLRRGYDQKTAGERIRLTGCYFTGIDPRTRQSAFLRDITKKLKGEKCVAYPQAYRDREESYTYWAYILCVATAILACADIVLLVKYLQRPDA